MPQGQQHEGTQHEGTQHEGRTRDAVVRLLMESGPITAGGIGAELGLSAAGVRRHLDALIEAGDAEVHPVQDHRRLGRGRPAKQYRLSRAGRGKLGHRYDDLALAAMRQLRAIGGEDAVRAFARQRIDGILAAVNSQADIESTAQQIAAALTKAGYVATTVRVNPGETGQDEAGQKDGQGEYSVQILQHHCPVADVAREFPELCQAERQAMAEVLGTRVQRLGTIAGGGYVCTTHIPLPPDKRR